MPARRKILNPNIDLTDPVAKPAQNAIDRRTFLALTAAAGVCAATPAPLFADAGVVSPTIERKFLGRPLSNLFQSLGNLASLDPLTESTALDAIYICGVNDVHGFVDSSGIATRTGQTRWWDSCGSAVGPNSNLVAQAFLELWDADPCSERLRCLLGVLPNFQKRDHNDTRMMRAIRAAAEHPLPAMRVVIARHGTSMLSNWEEEHSLLDKLAVDRNAEVRSAAASTLIARYRNMALEGRKKEMPVDWPSRIESLLAQLMLDDLGRMAFAKANEDEFITAITHRFELSRGEVQRALAGWLHGCAKLPIASLITLRHFMRSGVCDFLRIEAASIILQVRSVDEEAASVIEAGLLNSSAKTRAQTLELVICHNLQIHCLNGHARRLWEDSDQCVKSRASLLLAQSETYPPELFDSVVHRWMTRTDYISRLPSGLNTLMAGYGERSLPVVRTALLSDNQNLRDAALDVCQQMGTCVAEVVVAMNQRWSSAEECEWEWLLLMMNEIPIPTAAILPFVEAAASGVQETSGWFGTLSVIKARNIISLRIAELLLDRIGERRIDPDDCETLCRCGGPQFERMLLRRVRDTNIMVRADAARVLISSLTIPGETIVQTMCELLNDVDLGLSMIALSGLRIRIAEAAPALEPLRAFVVANDGPLAIDAQRLVNIIEFATAGTKHGRWSMISVTLPSERSLRNY